MAAQAQNAGPDHSARKRVVDLLAAASLSELKALWAELPEPPQAQFLRGPETGLVMVRGRIGGGGAPFNLGEVTVTRATCRLASGQVGHAQALGTSKEKARLSAISDALWQDEAYRDRVEALLVSVERRIEEADRRKAEEVAATKVDFFTMVRGED
ncbi:phosphonate C-P lyase system protein PhnG [Allorhizobium taibaishanense]|uniref:Alpha-D-ribose 1-methylphosphonate 5-triphosphate synthase subunit PhnG n=1 Tax=Allorhizobium taibaishanense TaxID=887144 RepID=A0A1Q9A8F2_9HYPH|nr:phosphonate C-P lyase system protein PhnG [Allorhizobium taibaishanense]MBB4009621.1 alpha-D-ribose 1-methylphosphonate 5-triphosphate synthase subunit PhnG [Allorhizobium taibaishanense]OLP50859.1 phosphonate C-P lyase system protein PhnG [Allorhizobium taibaishanense]